MPRRRNKERQRQFVPQLSTEFSQSYSRADRGLFPRVIDSRSPAVSSGQMGWGGDGGGISSILGSNDRNYCPYPGMDREGDVRADRTAAANQISLGLRQPCSPIVWGRDIQSRSASRVSNDINYDLPAGSCFNRADDVLQDRSASANQMGMALRRSRSPVVNSSQIGWDGDRGGMPSILESVDRNYYPYPGMGRSRMEREGDARANRTATATQMSLDLRMPASPMENNGSMVRVDDGGGPSYIRDRSGGDYCLSSGPGSSQQLDTRGDIERMRSASANQMGMALRRSRSPVVNSSQIGLDGDRGGMPSILESVDRNYYPYPGMGRSRVEREGDARANRTATATQMSLDLRMPASPMENRGSMVRVDDGGGPSYIRDRSGGDYCLSSGPGSSQQLDTRGDIERMRSASANQMGMALRRSRSPVVNSSQIGWDGDRGGMSSILESVDRNYYPYPGMGRSRVEREGDARANRTATATQMSLELRRPASPMENKGSMVRVDDGGGPSYIRDRSGGDYCLSSGPGSSQQLDTRGDIERMRSASANQMGMALRQSRSPVVNSSQIGWDGDRGGMSSILESVDRNYYPYPGMGRSRMEREGDARANRTATATQMSLELRRPASPMENKGSMVSGDDGGGPSYIRDRSGGDYCLSSGPGSSQQLDTRGDIERMRSASANQMGMALRRSRSPVVNSSQIGLDGDRGGMPSILESVDRNYYPYPGMGRSRVEREGDARANRTATATQMSLDLRMPASPMENRGSMVRVDDGGGSSYIRDRSGGDYCLSSGPGSSQQLDTRGDIERMRSASANQMGMALRRSRSPVVNSSQIGWDGDRGGMSSILESVDRNSCLFPGMGRSRVEREGDARANSTATATQMSLELRRPASPMENKGSMVSGDDGGGPSYIPDAPEVKNAVKKDAVKKAKLEDDQSDSDVSKDNDEIRFVVGSSENYGAIYLPGVNKSDDVDVSDVTPKDKTVKQTKKKGLSVGNLTKLTEKATKYFELKKPAERKAPAKRGGAAKAIKEGAPPPRTRRKRVINEGGPSLTEEDRQELIAEKAAQRLADAYIQAKSKQDIDDEVRALKRAGVLLPNGFTPVAPMFSQEGEDYLKMLGRS